MRNSVREIAEVILFDLGGVLVDWDGNAGLSNLIGEGFTEEDARRFWFLSPAVQNSKPVRLRLMSLLTWFSPS